MRYVLVSAAAAMALVGAATLGNAQAPDDKSKGPAAEGRGSAQDSAQDQAPQREPGADKKKPSQQTAPGRSSEPRAEGRPEPKSESRKGAQRDMDKDQPKATDRRPKDQSQDRPKSTDAPGKDRPKATTEQKPKDQPKATDRQPKDQPKSTDAPQPGKDLPKATEQKPKDQPKSTEGPQQGKVQVSEQQRTSVREKLVKETRVEKTRINVSVNIGTTIPRSVRLHSLPVAIVTLAPAYRGYSYIVLEDETICIVEPRTYVIVDVIAVGSQRADRPSRAQLALSPDQMRFIFTSVPKERRANVRVRLALGAEVPRDVELLAFPGVVTERVPEVRRYRYIVSGDDIVLVDPNDNAVVLVINE